MIEIMIMFMCNYMLYNSQDATHGSIGRKPLFR